MITTSSVYCQEYWSALKGDYRLQSSNSPNKETEIRIEKTSTTSYSIKMRKKDGESVFGKLEIKQKVTDKNYLHKIEDNFGEEYKYAEVCRLVINEGKVKGFSKSIIIGWYKETNQLTQVLDLLVIDEFDSTVKDRFAFIKGASLLDIIMK
jgi:hypothetical protein